MGKIGSRHVQLGLILAGILMAISGGENQAMAQNVANGELIAKTWCAGCHVVDNSAPKTARTDAIPSFFAVAQMPSTTQTSLRVFLGTPHARMPDYNLTQQEIRDVSSYILSLKR